MSKTSATVVYLKNWADHQYATVREALVDIDLTVEAHPEDATRILNTVWTGLAILKGHRKGAIPAPAWLSTIARFDKLTTADLNRLRDAIDMRLRAVERAAA